MEEEREKGRNGEEEKQKKEGEEKSIEGWKKQEGDNVNIKHDYREKEGKRSEGKLVNRESYLGPVTNVITMANMPL